MAAIYILYQTLFTDVFSPLISSAFNIKTSLVRQKTLNRLILFIDQFKEINFVNNDQMELHLDNVRPQFLQRTAEEYRDDRNARRSLKQGLENLREQASELAQEDTTNIVENFGQMGRRKFNLAA